MVKAFSVLWASVNVRCRRSRRDSFSRLKGNGIERHEHGGEFREAS